MKWLIGLSLVFVAVIGGLIVAGIIAFTIALDEWSKNDKG